VAGAIIYLEVDDEITSAAARIRSAEPTRIAVVLPHGSRVATSRINFRLLSRDALTHEKRLSLVSADSATRALAASAGLPVFASVAEYESAMAGLEDPSGVAPGAPAVVAQGSAADAAPAETAPPVVVLAAGETARTSTPGRKEPAQGRAPAATASKPAPDRPTITTSAAGTRGAKVRTSWLIGAGILALAVLVAGVGGYLLLPSATIVVTPRPEPIAPIELRVVADPGASEPGNDPPAVPAEILTVPVSVDDTFAVTGKRVKQTKATGTVRFENLDPTSTNRVVAGSIVSTNSGVRFRTDETITVGSADLIGFTIFPARASVAVTAVTGGPDGNVEPNTIVNVPPAESSIFLKVSNPDATEGGTREEIARVTQEDVDGALATLNGSLQSSFEAAIAAPDLAPDGATVFPASGTLGEATPTVPPESLVGQEIPEFSLGLSATGTVIAADPTPVGVLAEERLRTAVQSGYALVEGSVVIEVGDAVVIGQTVTFPVTVTADEIAILDPDSLEAMVLGKPVEEAQTILEPFGTVELSVSPDWTGSVPGFDSRVDLTIGQPVTIETPEPSTTP
jgi:hypothetical protein